MPPPFRRRVRKILLAVLLLGLAAWIVPSFFSAERYRRRIQRGLEQALHRPVKFGALSYRLLPRPGFSIENAEVAEDPDFGFEPFARIDHIDCDLRWHTLWRSGMDFAHLHLDHPSLNIVLNSRGEWNVERFLRQSGVTAPARSATGGGPSSLPQQLNLYVEDARINFQVGRNKKPTALTDVRASLQVDPAQGRVEFKAVASPLRSDLAIPTPGPVEVSGTWTPGSDLSGALDARLRTAGALLYDWIPVVTGRNPQVYGVVDADVHLTGPIPDLAVEGECNLTQIHRWKELPPSNPMPWRVQFRGRLVRGHERVQMDRVQAQFGGSNLRLSGSIDNLQSAPQLDLVISLERSDLADVTAVVQHLWPNAGSWGLRGPVEAMLAIRGPWNDRHYGGFVGARQPTLVTPSRSFPLSDLAVGIHDRGAVLAPVQIALAPRVALSAQGAIDRGKPGPRYELQLGAKGIPLHDVLAFGRTLGVPSIQGVDATGSVTATLHLAGPAWPPVRPVVTGRAEVRAARLLIPGLTEPVNLPRAGLQINGDQITVAPMVAVMGTSVFGGRLVHQGGRSNPWKFDLHANGLRLEQGALWFDALGRRQAVPLLERLPGVVSFAARRQAATQIFAGLAADGRFETPALSYRGVLLKDFQGEFEIADRKIRMNAAKFHADGGAGQAEGVVDFTAPAPALSAKVSIAGVALQSMIARLPGPIQEARGAVSAAGNFQTHGWAREDLGGNLAGRIRVRIKDLSFGDFDPLGALVEQAQWGRLESPHASAVASSMTMDLEIRDRRFILKPGPLDLSGALLQCDGTYAWGGVVNLNVRADFRRLRRHWIAPEDPKQLSAKPLEVRLSGPVDHLALGPPPGVASAAKGPAVGVVQ